MLIGTHALSPVLACYLVGKTLVPPLSRKELIMIALIGALPDLLNPHIDLASRHTSWSHSLIGMLAFTTLYCFLSAFFHFFPKRLIPYAALCYLWHLICDWFSGGIPYLYPILPDVIGAQWLHPRWWLPFDIFFLTGLFLIISHERRRRAAHKTVSGL